MLQIISNKENFSDKTVSVPLPEISYEQAQNLKKESIWKELAKITVDRAFQEWLNTLSRLTAKNYASGIAKLSEVGLFDSNMSLQSFSLINHNAIVDQIKNLSNLSESSKQARAACYISFTNFLHRRTQGIIKKAIPNKEGTFKTFYRVREKVTTEAMSRAQWTSFLYELSLINTRDCLIAKVILQGGKRVSEVLSITSDKINFSTREITFHQSKTKGYEKQTVITYPQELLDHLKEYLGDRKGLVFITRRGRRIMLNQLATTFEKAGKKAGVPFKVTPHVLRASTVTYLKREGFNDSEIMKVTGHASSEMVHAYDKSERSLNASKKVCLI